MPLGDNVTDTAYSTWIAAIGEASTDWTASTVLDSPVVAGAASNPKRCGANNGRIEVCNTTYGSNGWLGLASIWTSGGHIVKASAKMNDTNFNSTRYDYTAERHVMCQEVGHGYGLGHQDESGADLNTCMDYANALDNAHPNQHDYDQLKLIYSHTDSTSTVSAMAATKFPENASPVATERRDTIATSYIVHHYGNGYRLHTFVTWAVPHVDDH